VVNDPGNWGFDEEALDLEEKMVDSEDRQELEKSPQNLLQPV
jgi:hypothetical protein